ncbi:MAG: VWA domain-containing protein [Thermoanaerobaculia bacterium]
MSGQLFGNVLLFGRVLRGLGLDAGPDRMTDLVRALGLVPIGSKGDVRHAARALLVRRKDEIPLFEEAFEAFWRKPPDGETTMDLRSMGERRRFRRPAFAPDSSPDPSPRDGGAKPREDEPPRLQVTLTYSAQELLRHKDFGELTAEELDEVRRAIRGLAWKLSRARTRRLRSGEGRALDLRRTLRRSLRHGGEVLEWARRGPRSRARPLVVLADISGSMERYTRLLLLFLHALSEGLEGRTETFLFGTRLTRITREISGKAPEEALANVAGAVPDWSGGTRIGEALHEFNFRWGRRVLSRGAAVLLISDGWDRGDPALLAAEMARLQRSAHRVIWLNPLLGSSEYEPLTRGIRAALPYVDDFLPVHNLASLESLARRLETLPEQRPLRRQQPRAPSASDARVR